MVLGRRIDDAALAALRAPNSAAVAITDGRRLRASVGDAAGTAEAAHFIGSEAAGTFVDPAGEWAGAAIAFGDGIWLLGIAEKGTRPLPEPAGWGGAGLGALLFIAGAIPLVLRRRSATVPLSTTGGGVSSGMPEFRAPVSRVVALNPASGRGTVSAPEIRAPRGPAAATALAAESTQQFGRYTLLKRIGEGGMAEVFTAILSGAEGFERLVVIKRLRPHLALNPDAVAQFIDEAKLGSVLTHSNIVTVSDFGKVGDGYFLAAEYVSGHTLAAISARHAEKFGRPLPAAFVFYMAHEVLAALGYAHERTDPNGRPLGIVHRDVSPTNVMVNFEGEVKLLDFGIVKATERVSRTREGNVKGNVGYMSPEQARGGEVSNRSDLYSLGLVMFDLLAGEPFYQGSGSGEILYLAATGPTAEHLARIGGLPPPAPEVLRNVLSIDPAGRYPTARAFSQAIGQSVTVAKSQLAELMRVLFRDAAG
jgi:serine/threonine-protein kinase